MVAAPVSKLLSTVLIEPGLVADFPSGLEAAELPPDAVEVGRILDAWGLQGWFKILSYSAQPQALLCCKDWFLQPASQGRQTFSGSVLLAIKQAKMHADSVVACAHALSDRTAVLALRGARVFIARSNFPRLPANEYYWLDLIGSSVVNRQGQVLGRVHDLLATGAQTVLLLRDDGVSPALERMIPFVGAYIDEVDIKARRILVDWQPDY